MDALTNAECVGENEECALHVAKEACGEEAKCLWHMEKDGYPPTAVAGTVVGVVIAAAVVRPAITFLRAQRDDVWNVSQMQKNLQKNV